MTDTVGFWKLAEEDPTRVALITPEEEDVTAGSIASAANRIAHGLRGLGLTPGDGIAVVLPNSREFYEVFFAAMESGWYFTPINYHLVGPEVAYIVNDCEAKAFIGDGRFAEVCQNTAKELDLPSDRWLSIGDIPGFRRLEEITEGQPDTTPEDRTAGTPMHYTSGTTGRPKGVRRGLTGLDPDSERVLYAGLLQMFGIKPHDDSVHICGSPLYHTAPLVFSSSAFQLGHLVVLMDKWTPELMLDLIQRYGVTHSHMVPTQFHRLLALPENVRSKYDVSSLRHMIHAAAPCPIDIKQRMLDWWGPVIYEYYAATEGGGTLVTPQEWLERPGTVGKSWATSEIRTLDDEGKDVGVREPGTVYMKLGAAAFEYFKDKNKTEGNRREGFFTVGDVGYLDEDSYLFLLDRKSDMIISGGVNIYPAEIENALMSHPKVADAAVFGIPHEDWGEEIKAVVEPAPDVEPGEKLTEDLRAFLSERVAKFKIPKSFDYTNEMPRDPNGKLYKRKLRDPYWEGRTRAI